jgi:UDP-N-acetylmuramyl pentapeptide phosphotransferase/UDP-N-acetylglucosamine-1-phosphate transferase
MNLIQNLSVALAFSLLISFALYYLFNKNNILLDQVNSSKHKLLTTKYSDHKVTLCGGIIIFLCSILFFDNQLLVLKILSAFIVFIGILSDIDKLNSPKIRIIYQFFIVLLLLLLNENLAINDLRIDFFNNILEIKSISILFTIFCILILINGTNFLDGVNTLVIGYYMIVLGIIIITSIQFNLNINNNIFYFIIFLATVFIFNFFNKIYLGDSGSYLVSFFTAFFILDFVSQNYLVSPYFFCLLLWYPAFENLFSILRRVILKKKLEKADQGHLHQMLYNFIDSKKFCNKKYLNTTTGILINLFNLLIFTISFEYYLNTKYLVLFIFINIFLYLLLYFFIKKKVNHLK